MARRVMPRELGWERVMAGSRTGERYRAASCRSELLVTALFGSSSMRSGCTKKPP